VEAYNVLSVNVQKIYTIILDRELRQLVMGMIVSKLESCLFQTIEHEQDIDRIAHVMNGLVDGTLWEVLAQAYGYDRKTDGFLTKLSL
jgi:hypothetical protein